MQLIKHFHHHETHHTFSVFPVYRLYFLRPGCARSYRHAPQMRSNHQSGNTLQTPRRITFHLLQRPQPRHTTVWSRDKIRRSLQTHCKNTRPTLRRSHFKTLIETGHLSPSAGYCHPVLMRQATRSPFTTAHNDTTRKMQRQIFAAQVFVLSRAHIPARI